ncbi:MAG: AraC family ligand binding domain-containing protein, partial [Bacteroidota bacterium]
MRQLFQGHLTGAITDHSIIAPHRLSFHMIFLVTKGEGQHYIDFQSYAYKKGSILFLTKGQIHAWEVKEENDGLLIVFSEAFLQQSFGFSSVLQYYRLFNYQLYTPIHQLEAFQFVEFMDLFSKLKREYNEPNDFAKEKIIGSLMSYLLLKAERLTRQKKLPVENEHYQKLFIDFKNLLFANYKNDRNAAYYADNLGISYKHLNEVCKATINQTAKA